ncbi:MAG: UpxY family transcription antiterminator [Candidatus Acidiferrales bacterium]|jgi:transcription antitermination factor NusG
MTTNVKPTTPHPADSIVASPLYPWFALQVRTRQESSVGDQLNGQGYEQFLPMYKVRKRWSDRIKEVEAPLFPGYLFCRFNPHDRLPILKTPGVIQIVGFKEGPTAVDESEIRSIQTLVAAGVPHQPWPFLSAGDRVRIDSGPLVGLEGILTEVKRSHRLVLSVTLLQRSVAVEIDSALVTAIKTPLKKGPEKSKPQEQDLPVPA